MGSFLFYLPYIFAISYTNSSPALSYWISWWGSIFIIVMSFSGFIKKRPTDLPFFNHFFRPYILFQLIFAGYNCLSTFFYYFHIDGYMFFQKIGNDVSEENLIELARCQNYYVLAHSAFAQGMILNISKYSTQKLEFIAKLDLQILFKIIIASFLISQIFKILGLFSGISGMFASIVSISSALYFILAIKEKQKILIAFGLFFLNVASLLSTGMKEGLLFFAIILIINLFPIYKIPTIIIAILVAQLFTYLPAYTSNVRMMIWFGTDKNITLIDVAKVTYEQVNTKDEVEKLKNTKQNWAFLTLRLSEVDAFIKYTNFVPKVKEYYGVEMLQNGLYAMIPKRFRPDGKSIDETASERTLAAGALERFSWEEGTSANPACVADAYMLNGTMGILMMLFSFGWILTNMSLYTEKLFGGYTLGTLLVFTSTFYFYTKGGCIENMFNTLFQASLAIGICYFMMKYFRLFK